MTYTLFLFIAFIDHINALELFSFENPSLLTPHIEIIEDKDHQLNINDVIAGKYNWSSVDKGQYFTGQNPTAKYWYRLTLHWNGENTQNAVLYFDVLPNLLADIGIRIPQMDGSFQIFKTGSIREYDSRDIQSYLYGFNLMMTPGNEYTIYGWASNVAVPIPLNLKLTSSEDFRDHHETYKIILAIFYAVMGALMVYNIFLFITIKENVYGIYILFLLGAASTCANFDGVGHRWIWPQEFMDTRAAAINPSLACMAYLSFVFFSLNKVDFWPYFKKIHYSLLITGVLLLAFSLTVPVEGLRIAIVLGELYTAIVFIICLSVIIASVVNRVPTASYLLFAELLNITGLAIFMLMFRATLPMNIFTQWAMHFGFAADALLLSLSLGARTRIAQMTAINHLANYENLYQESVEGRFQYQPSIGIFKCNRAMAAIYGYHSVDELIGEKRKVYLSDEETENKLRQILKSNDSVNDFEAQIINKQTNQPVWISLNLRLIPHSDKKIKLVEGSVVDITERKLKESAERAQQISEAQNKAKSQFFASMSHELRTPLTAILGYAEIAKQQKLDTFTRIKHVSTIERSGKHLLQLINDILDLSKIEAQKLDVEMLRTNVIEIVRDIEDYFLILSEKKRISFTKAFRFPFPGTIQTDPTRLKQVLINICGNSVKFTEKGGVTIETYLNNETGMMCFAIKDTGIGLKPEQVNKLFGAFVQADASTTRNFGGTGLGLHLSKQIAEKLGGDITVESEYGEGSTFTVSIATGDMTNAQFLTELPEETTKDEQYETPQLAGKILYAEDNPQSAQLVAEIVTRTGCTIELADNGKYALELALANEFDLIFTDLRMPEKNGIELTKELKQSKPNSVIYGITAENTSDVIAEFTLAGAKGVLGKPILGRALCDVLSQNLPEANATNESTSDEPKPLRVLLVEDNPVNQRLIGFHIKKAGAEVVIANDGLEAIAEALKSEFDVIFMDVYMPNLGGMEAVELLRKKGIEKPIYALTATDTVEDKDKCLQVGCNGILFKPLDVTKLTEVLNGLKAALAPSSLKTLNPSLQLIHDDLLTMKPKFLLVADDVKENRELIQSWLEPYPIKVTLAVNGEEAILHAKNTKFDAILLDVSMPKVDGLEAARNIRASEIDTSIIFLTGHSEQTYVDICKKAGGNSFITKPIDQDLFWPLINDLFLNNELHDTYLNDANCNVNFDEMYEDCGDDKIVLVELEEFLKDADNIQNKISENIHDAVILESIIHEFRGTCSRVYAPHLINLLMSIGDKIKSHGLEEAANLINEKLFGMISDVEQIIRNKKAQLATTQHRSIQ